LSKQVRRLTMSRAYKCFLATCPMIITAERLYGHLLTHIKIKDKNEIEELLANKGILKAILTKKEARKIIEQVEQAGKELGCKEIDNETMKMTMKEAAALMRDRKQELLRLQEKTADRLAHIHEEFDSMTNVYGHPTLQYDPKKWYNNLIKRVMENPGAEMLKTRLEELAANAAKKGEFQEFVKRTYHAEFTRISKKLGNPEAKPPKWRIGKDVAKISMPAYHLHILFGVMKYAQNVAEEMAEKKSNNMEFDDMAIGKEHAILMHEQSTQSTNKPTNHGLKRPRKRKKRRKQSGKKTKKTSKKSKPDWFTKKDEETESDSGYASSGEESKHESSTGHAASSGAASSDPSNTEPSSSSTDDLVIRLKAPARQEPTELMTSLAHMTMTSKPAADDASKQVADDACKQAADDASKPKLLIQQPTLADLINGRRLIRCTDRSTVQLAIRYAMLNRDHSRLPVDMHDILNDRREYYPRRSQAVQRIEIQTLATKYMIWHSQPLQAMGLQLVENKDTHKLGIILLNQLWHMRRAALINWQAMTTADTDKFLAFKKELLNNAWDSQSWRGRDECIADLPYVERKKWIEDNQHVYGGRGRGHKDRGRRQEERGKSHGGRGRGHEDRGSRDGGRGRGHEDRGRDQRGRGRGRCGGRGRGP